MKSNNLFMFCCIFFVFLVFGERVVFGGALYVYQLGNILRLFSFANVIFLANNGRNRILGYMDHGCGPLPVREFRFEQFFQRGLAELSHFYRR